jgi:hypothetical protein
MRHGPVAVEYSGLARRRNIVANRILCEQLRLRLHRFEISMHLVLELRYGARVRVGLVVGPHRNFVRIERNLGPRL